VTAGSRYQLRAAPSRLRRYAHCSYRSDRDCSYGAIGRKGAKRISVPVACERYEAEGGQFVADEERHGQTITGITRSRHVNLAEVGAQNTGRLRRSILGARDKVALNGEWRLRVAILKMNLPNHSVLSGG
jgi:hypothetical protein